MMRSALRAVGGFLCLLAMPGCTQVVADYAGKVEVRENRVAEVTRAWRGEDRDLVICVRGWPAERARDVAPVEYHMTVPLGLFEDPEGASPLLVQGDSRIRTLVVPAERIANGCPKQPDGAGDVETETVGADYFASVSPRDASDEQIERFADPGIAGATLFAFDIPTDPPDTALMYRSDQELFEGSRLVWIDPGNKPVKPNQAAYLGLPLAFATDVVLVAGFVVVFAVFAVASVGL